MVNLFFIKFADDRVFGKARVHEFELLGKSCIFEWVPNLIQSVFNSACTEGIPAN